jgi:hypothetical protein
MLENGSILANIIKRRITIYFGNLINLFFLDKPKSIIMHVKAITRFQKSF